MKLWGHLHLPNRHSFGSLVLHHLRDIVEEGKRKVVTGHRIK